MDQGRSYGSDLVIYDASDFSPVKQHGVRECVCLFVFMVGPLFVAVTVRFLLALFSWEVDSVAALRLICVVSLIMISSVPNDYHCTHRCTYIPTIIVGCSLHLHNELAMSGCFPGQRIANDG